MTDERNAKAWPRFFADSIGLFGALSAIHEADVGRVGSSGGHLRELYAAALDEAAVALDNAAVADAAQAWRAVADLLEELADAAVPPDPMVPPRRSRPWRRCTRPRWPARRADRR